MLSKKNRLSREKFKNISWSRKNFFSTHFALSVASGLGKNFAVNVSKKVSKLAAKRNTLRRRAYAALGQHMKEWPAGTYLLRAKSGGDKLSSEKIQEEVYSLLKQISKNENKS